MSHQKSNPSKHELFNKRTSAGVRFADVPEDSRHLVEWIEGCHSFHAQLPSLDDLPIPVALTELPRLHPDRPRGSRAMLCAHGAKGRLDGLRAGAWTVTPFNDWRFAVFDDGEIGWIPKETVLPKSLFVPFRNDIN